MLTELRGAVGRLCAHGTEHRHSKAAASACSSVHVFQICSGFPFPQILYITCIMCKLNILSLLGVLPVITFNRVFPTLLANDKKYHENYLLPRWCP